MQIGFYKIQICPECGEQGQFVKNATVKHIVKKEFQDKAGDNDFHFCRNPSCDAGYYNTDSKITILKDQFKRPIWLKEDSEPVIACYCTNITEEDVIRTVIETDLTELRQIMFYLKGKIGDSCHCMNPTGHCCTAFFKECISKGLKIKSMLIKYDELNPDSVKASSEINSKLTELNLL